MKNSKLLYKISGTSLLLLIWLFALFLRLLVLFLKRLNIISSSSFLFNLDILTVIIFEIVVVFLLLKKNRTQLANHNLSIGLILIFFAISLSSIVYSLNPYLTLKGILRIGCGILMFPITLLTLRDEIDFKKFLYLFLVLIGAVAFASLVIFGIRLLYLGYTFRLRGPFLHPNGAGNFFITSFYIIFVTLVTGMLDRKRTKILILFLVLTFVTLLFTRSRSSWLSGYIFAIFLLHMLISSPKKRKYFLISILLLSATLLIAVLISPPIKNFLRLSYEQNISIIRRILIWRYSLQRFISSPFIGTGLFAFSEIPQDQFPDYIDFRFTHSHNYFLSLATEVGIQGMIMFVILVIFFLKRGFKNLKNFDRNSWQWKGNLIFLSAFIVLLICQLFDSSLRNDYRIQMLFYTSASVLCVLKKIPTVESSP
jgi:O-antigen ligase